MVEIAYNVKNNNGKSIKEYNLALKHNIPLGEKVQINSPYNDEHGLTLYVVSHERDCDGEPLYSLSMFSPDDDTWDHLAYMGFDKNAMRSIMTHGFSESSLIPINNKKLFNSEMSFEFYSEENINVELLRQDLLNIRAGILLKVPPINSHTLFPLIENMFSEVDVQKVDENTYSFNVKSNNKEQQPLTDKDVAKIYKEFLVPMIFNHSNKSLIATGRFEYANNYVNTIKNEEYVADLCQDFREKTESSYTGPKI